MLPAGLSEGGGGRPVPPGTGRPCPCLAAPGARARSHLPARTLSGSGARSHSAACRRGRVGTLRRNAAQGDVGHQLCVHRDGGLWILKYVQTFHTQSRARCREMYLGTLNEIILHPVTITHTHGWF